jgi:thiaminase
MYNYSNEIKNLICRLEALKNMWRKWIDYFKIGHIKNQVAEIKKLMDNATDDYIIRAAKNALGVFEK